MPTRSTSHRTLPSFHDYSVFCQTWGKTTGQPFFTIITVCLNRTSTIKRALESIWSQTFKDFELIVIDGGSTDGTLEILRTYESKITKLVVEKDHGIYDAFNRGIVVSSGRWICFVNSDDQLNPDALTKVKAELDRNPNLEILCGQTRFMAADGSSMVFESRPDLLKYESTVGHNATYVRRDVHERIGLYRTDLKLASDYDFFLRCRKQGVTFKSVPEVLVNMGAGGASDKHWVSLQAEMTQVQKDVLNQGLSADLRHAKRLIRGILSRTLTQAGLKSLVSWYRRHFALVRKT